MKLQELGKTPLFDWDMNKRSPDRDKLQGAASALEALVSVNKCAVYNHSTLLEGLEILDDTRGNKMTDGAERHLPIGRGHEIACDAHVGPQVQKERALGKPIPAMVAADHGRHYNYRRGRRERRKRIGHPTTEKREGRSAGQSRSTRTMRPRAQRPRQKLRLHRD